MPICTFLPLSMYLVTYHTSTPPSSPCAKTRNVRGRLAPLPSSLSYTSNSSYLLSLFHGGNT